ncbi:MAG TPA: DUF2092 domain-containing protein [Candidatus Hydrogenedentes bacterium]|nr:DUF2092 domain-containing protein [Candidatus Hydrogenedentota bacterium]
MNSTARIPWLLLIAIVLGVSLARAQEAPEVAVDARPLLDKAIGFYAGLDAVRTKIELALTVTEKGEEPETVKNAFSVAIRRPRQLAVKAEGDSMNIEIVCDGSKLYVYSPEDNLYAENEAPETPANAVGMTGRGILRVGTMMMSEVFRVEPFKTLTEDLEAARDFGEAIVDGVACRHVACTHPEVDWEMWIAGGDRPLVQKMAIDVTKLMADSGDDATTYDLVIAYRDWDINPDLPEATFAFTPPEGAQKMDPSAGAGHAANPESLEGKPAPEFSLELLGGGTMSLASHKGKDVVILDFWATWCGPCRQALPVYARVAKAYKDKGVVFYAVNLGEGADLIKPFMEKMELDCPVALDTERDAAGKYGIRSIPTSVIIGKDGVVRKVHIGLAEELEASLARELDDLLEEKSGAK